MELAWGGRAIVVWVGATETAACMVAVQHKGFSAQATATEHAASVSLSATLSHCLQVQEL